MITQQWSVAGQFKRQETFDERTCPPQLERAFVRRHKHDARKVTIEQTEYRSLRAITLAYGP